MKTICKYSTNKSILFALTLIISSYNSYADSINNTSSVFSEDNTASYYIIGGVLGFGIVIFLINNILNRSNNFNETKNNTNNRSTTSHRYRYNQHRVMRKTSSSLN